MENDQENGVENSAAGNQAERRDMVRVPAGNKAPGKRGARLFMTAALCIGIGVGIGAAVAFAPPAITVQKMKTEMRTPETGVAKKAGTETAAKAKPDAALPLAASTGAGVRAKAAAEKAAVESLTASAAPKAMPEAAPDNARDNAQDAISGTAADTMANTRLLDIQLVTSPSGITAWLVEDHSLPLIAVEFAFQGAGAAHDPEDRQGLTLMASNTMDEGAADLDSQAFQKTLTDYSISLSFYATRDDFGGSLKMLSRRGDLAFDLLRKAVTAPRFDAEAVDRMRAANLARLRSSLSSPNWLAARVMNDTAFSGHPYALNIGGTMTSLAAITPDDLRHFARTRLGRDRLVVAAAGAITPDDLAAALDRVFGDLPAHSPLPDVPDLTVQNGGQIVLLRRDMPQTIIEIMQPGMGRDDPAYHSYQIMNFIFGGSGFGSRLMDEVREKRGLTYGIYSGTYMMDHLKALSVSASTENRNAAAVIALTRQEMEKMRTEPAGAQELADAKSYIIGSLPLGLSSTDRIARMMLGLRLDDLPADYLDTLAPKIEAVTAEDIRDTAAAIMTPDNLTVILVGNPDDIEPSRLVEKLPHVE